MARKAPIGKHRVESVESGEGYIGSRQKIMLSCGHAFTTYNAPQYAVGQRRACPLCDFKSLKESAR